MLHSRYYAYAYDIARSWARITAVPTTYSEDFVPTSQLFRDVLINNVNCFTYLETLKKSFDYVNNGFFNLSNTHI